jgi:queuosine precursor transporter
MSLGGIDIGHARTRAFVYLMTVHSAVLVASNAGGAKIIALPGGLAASATAISYIMSFVILDSIAEIFGRAYSRTVIHVGLVAGLVSVVFFELSIALPPSPVWHNQEAYEQVLGASPRILIGGWSAYLISQYIDLYSFLRLKATRLAGRFLWLRAWGAMVVSQIIDTAIFVTIAFYGVVPLLSTMVGQYLIKMAFATLATPIVYLFVGLGRTLLGDAPAPVATTASAEPEMPA